MTRRQLIARCGLLGAVALAGLTACVPKFEAGSVLTITPTGSGGVLSWPAATELDQGQTLASYRIDVDGAEVARIPASVPACNLAGLTAGAHTVSITAYDSANEWSGTLASDGRLSGSLTPPEPAPTGTMITCEPGPQAPGAPANVAAQPLGDGSASVSWTPSTAAGTAAIESYIITPYREGVAEPEISAGAESTSATLTTLTNGYEYTFTVRALNSVGQSSESAPSGSVGIVGSILRLGQRLTGGHSLYSPSGQYRLNMQEDGNLVLYSDGRVVWATYTQNAPGAHLTLQEDSNLVLRSSGGAPLWYSGTQGRLNPYVIIQNDANLVIYSTSTGPWALGSYNDRLASGQFLRPNWYLQNGGRTAHLTMQGDGNFVLYKSGRAVWSTGTAGNSNATARMQEDGNLVVRNTGGGAIWNSGTAGHTGAILVLQSDGNAQIIWNGQALWSSNPGSQQAIVDDYPEPWRSGGLDQYVDDWGYYSRECTSFVAWRLHARNGFEMPRAIGNAGVWRNRFPNQTNSTPAVGAIAENSGHVAWVSRVNANGTVTVEEYNVPAGSGRYSTRTVPASTFWYIHVKDL